VPFKKNNEFAAKSEQPFDVIPLSLKLLPGWLDRLKKVDRWREKVRAAIWKIIEDGNG
jgi:hypothetical protein